MTKQEMLASLEAQIRKDIPRLMELREGCLLMKNEKHDNVLKRGEIVKISCLWNDIIQVSPIGEPLSRNYVECQIKDLFEVIGHEIMLNDVLEWLGKVLKEATEYRIGYTNIGKFGVKYREMLGVMDLSKPLLKDQSEYFIKFLYEFKNEHFKI